MPNPAEWRDALVRRLDTRWGQLRIYDAYYEGDQMLAYATQKFRDTYGGLFRELADNWMPIVVDSSAERLKVQGFRFGPDQDADDDAWEIWQANNLDGQANMLHTEAIKLSEAYWLVQPNGDTPKITAEHPSQVIVACAPGDRTQRLAAIKKWQGEENKTYVNLYLPDRVYKYRSQRAPDIIDGIVARSMKWDLVETVPNPLGVVPIIPAPNRPSMIHGGRSDLAGGPIRIQDGINKLLADMLVGSEYTAFRQRVMLGVDQPRDAQGKPIPIDTKEMERQSTQSRLWMFPGKDVKAMEFSATDLDNFTKAIEGLVRHLTAQTRTPPHYVSGQLVNVSGDALKAAETGLVSKVRDKQEPFGEAHEEAMRLAFLSIDAEDPRAKATDAETIWADPESRSMAEVVDAVTKEVAIGLPFEIALEKMGYSPQEIDRILAIKETDALLAPEPPPTAPQPTDATQAPPPAGPAASGTP